MGIGHSPKNTPKRPRTMSSGNADENEDIDANDIDVNDPTTAALYTIMMNNNAMLTELTKMFQYQFNENNLIKAELEEIKKVNAQLVKKLEKLPKPQKESSSEAILSTVKEVKKSIQDGLSKVSDSIASSPSMVKTMSYSAVARGSSSVIVVKPKNQSQTSDETKTVMRKTIDTAKFPIQGVRNVNNGGIAIECKNKELIAQLKADAESKLGASYEITAPPAKCPKVKIIGITSDADNKFLISRLTEQNEDIFKGCQAPKIVHKFKTKNSIGIKLEVSGDLFKKIMSARRVTIGWDTCIVYESIDVTRCYKCCGYHHLAKSCKASIVCSKCGLDHDFKACKSDTFKCINCVNASKALKTTIDATHSAFSQDCPVFNRKVEMEKRRIDYEFSSPSAE